jgi:hypothetical protein
LYKMAEIARPRTFRNGDVQVDACPGEEGLILSVGRTSLWVNMVEALDVARALARALEHHARADGEHEPDAALARLLPIRRG